MTGRKQLTTPPENGMVIDHEGFGDHVQNVRDGEHTLVEAQLQHNAAVRAVALRVGYQLPADAADPDLIQRDIAANMRRSVEACLEVGRGLMVLKEACQHGEFMARLDVLGLDDRVARRFMQAATKFANRALTSTLTKALGNQTKLFEMLVLDDEQIEELELTGQTGELKLDDVATMSVKELRAKLREMKQELEAKDGVLKKRAEQIDALDQKLARVKTMPQDEALAELHAEAAKHYNDALGAVKGNFSAAIAALAEHRDTGGADSTLLAAGMVADLQRLLNDLRERFGLPDTAADAVPDWVGNPEFEKFAPGAGQAE